MPQTKPTTIALGLAFFGLLPLLHAQESANSAGGEASSPEGHISYSVGQTMYTSDQSDNGSVNMGVQQPYDIQIITNNAADFELDIQLSVFPNPALDQLLLEFGEDNPLNHSLTYVIQDLNGVRLRDGHLNGSSHTINVADLSPATYLLTVSHGSDAISTFRIVKL